MHRPSAQEFLLKLLETMEDLPPDFARRFEEVLKKEDGRSLAGDPQAFRGRCR